MKKGIVNWRRYADGKGNPVGEVNTMPSKTVPNMALTIDELIAKYTRGERSFGIMGSQGVYVGDEIPDGIEHLDPMEKRDMVRDLNLYITDARSRLAAQQKARKKENVKSVDGDDKPIDIVDVG